MRGNSAMESPRHATYPDAVEVALGVVRECDAQGAVAHLAHITDDRLRDVLLVVHLGQIRRNGANAGSCVQDMRGTHSLSHAENACFKVSSNTSDHLQWPHHRFLKLLSFLFYFGAAVNTEQ